MVSQLKGFKRVDLGEMKGPAMDALDARKDDNNDPAAEPAQWTMYFASVKKEFFTSVRQLFPGVYGRK